MAVAVKSEERTRAASQRAMGLARAVERAASLEPDSANAADAIHDVRVAARRLAQALRPHRASLGSESYDKLRLRLRKLLRLCGDVRDWDIAIELLRSYPDLTPIFERRRLEAWDKLRPWLRHRVERHTFEHWGDRLDSLPEASHAHPPVAEAMRAFFRAGEAASKPSSTPATLHRFRLRTKKLRYTLELRGGFVSVLKRLRSIQRELGRISDCATTERLLAEIPTARPALRFLRSERSRHAQAFRKLWRERIASLRATWVARAVKAN